MVAELADIRLSTAKLRPPRIGLVLGSGAARGWAHIGVIRALEQAGVRPDVVCGTSVGALVGAAYATGDFERFCAGTSVMRRRDVVSFMDVALNGGLLKGERFMAFVTRVCKDRPIEDLAIPFAAVATSLQTGAEVWLRTGSTMNAVRASLAMPGLFTPVMSSDGILVDGALVNPVPVSLARAMGADIVIAVDVSRLGAVAMQAASAPGPNATQTWSRTSRRALLESELAGATVVIRPTLVRTGMLDFERKLQHLAAGEDAARHVVSELNQAIAAVRTSKRVETLSSTQ